MQKYFETLNTIYQKAEMGRDGFFRLIKATDDTSLRQSLATKMNEFQSILDSSEHLLHEKGEKPSPVNPVSKMASTVMSNIKTKVDNTPTHIAGMIIKGCTVGIDKVNESVNKSNVTDQQVKNLSDNLIQTARSSIEEMKKFL